jgi:c-di-GMP-binding flagellar brake protein YcgR
MKPDKKKFERRQYQRKRCFCLIKYRPFGQNTEYIETLASLRNISANGMLFKSKEYLPTNAQLEIKINMPPLGEIIRVIASVIRLDRIVKEEGYWVGVTYLKIAEEDKKRLLNFATVEKKKI